MSVHDGEPARWKPTPASRLPGTRSYRVPVAWSVLVHVEGPEPCLFCAETTTTIPTRITTRRRFWQTHALLVVISR
jgi:hypothetical protein